MSTRIMALCWPLKMPPTAKAVLVSLADNANDNGHCWPSIPTVCERTCFSRRAVIDAIAWLEVSGALTADRSNGRHTTYVVTPEKFTQPVQQAHQCISRTGASGAQTSASPALDQCISRTGPVQQPHPNRKEPSRTVEASVKKVRATAPPCSVTKPADVSDQTWADWLTLRRAKKAPVTETVFASAVAEAGKAGLSLERFLAVWCARGSQGLEASWLKPNERAGPPTGKPSAAADFRGKTYDATPDDQLPPGLR